MASWTGSGAGERIFVANPVLDRIASGGRREGKCVSNQGWMWTFHIGQDEFLSWLHSGLTGVKTVTSINRSSKTVLDLTTARIPVWAVVLAVFLFPIGLVCLVARQMQTFQVRTEDAGNGWTRIYLTGSLTHPLRARLLEVHQHLAASVPAA